MNLRATAPYISELCPADGVAGLHPTDPAAVEAYAHEFTSEIKKGVEDALESLITRVAHGLDVERVVLSGNLPTRSTKLYAFATWTSSSCRRLGADASVVICLAR